MFQNSVGHPHKTTAFWYGASLGLIQSFLPHFSMHLLCTLPIESHPFPHPQSAPLFLFNFVLSLRHPPVLYNPPIHPDRLSHLPSICPELPLTNLCRSSSMLAPTLRNCRQVLPSLFHPCPEYLATPMSPISNSRPPEAPWVVVAHSVHLHISRHS